MSVIKLLPDKIINQIAAGEVVERPISVIKELFENAVDAGSAKITIRINNGGKTLIRVTDDGKGMARDDLVLAVERHATSKLNEGDLSLISTHGFRGEALPSIGSVSQLSVTSRTYDSDVGYKVLVDFGAKSEIQPASHNIGTSVEVLNLFAALPARLKFLKSDNVERNLILEFVQHMSLCYTAVAISLISDGEEIFNSAAAEELTKEKIASVFGNEFAKNMVEIDAQGNFSISGFVGQPTFMRPNATSQIFFVNKRLVKDKVLYRAIKVAYQNLMMVGKHAAVILKLDFNPYDIDVNVHPAKTEVRFYEADKVIGFIANTIRARLSAAHVEERVVQHPTHSYEPPKAVFRASERAHSLYRPQMQVTMPVESEVEEYPLGNALMQINRTYIVAKSQNGLILVDQHAAHERVNLEMFKKAANERSVPKQYLTVPIVIDFSAAQLNNLCDMQEQLSNFGFEVEKNGITQLAVHSVPTIFNAENTVEFMKSLSEELDNPIVKEDYKKFFDAIMGNIACKLSIKANEELSLFEMNKLLRDIEKTNFGGECNHGRPTFLLLDEKELAKLFCRI